MRYPPAGTRAHHYGGMGGVSFDSPPNFKDRNASKAVSTKPVRTRAGSKRNEGQTLAEEPCWREGFPDLWDVPGYCTRRPRGQTGLGAQGRSPRFT